MRYEIEDEPLEVAVLDDDPIFAKAIFLSNHPGWSPDDYDRADQELIQTMNLLTAAQNEALRRASRVARGPSRAALLAAQSRQRR